MTAPDRCEARADRGACVAGCAVRVRCEDDGLQSVCQREAKCNAYGKMDNMAAVEEQLGPAMKRKCLDKCRCATINCWGILWF